MDSEKIEYDFKKIHQDLSTTYKRQMEIKREFPHRYQDTPNWPWADVNAWRADQEKRRPWRVAREEFDRLSERMTALCCLINHAKGKLHMSHYDGEEFTKEDQYYFIKGLIEEYTVGYEPPKPKETRKSQGIVGKFVKALGL